MAETELERTELDRRALAVARGRAWDLLGSLVRSGPVRLDHLRAVAALAPHLPEAVDDEVLAVHQRVFGQEIPPYESVFREPTALLGGAVSARVRAAMDAAGFDPDTRETEPDHLATELSLLAWLCGAEADAWRDGLEATAHRIEGLQRAFLEAHLLAWLPPLVVAVDAVDPGGLYAAAVRLVLALAADQATPPAEALPPVADPLDDPETGMRELGAFLAIPHNVGVLLGPSWLRARGRAAGLPVGMGSRAMLVENLLQTAIRQSALPAALGAMDAALAADASTLGALPGGAPWAARVGATRAVIARLAAAGTGEETGEPAGEAAGLN